MWVCTVLLIRVGFDINLNWSRIGFYYGPELGWVGGDEARGRGRRDECRAVGQPVDVGKSAASRGGEEVAARGWVGQHDVRMEKMRIR